MKAFVLAETAEAARELCAGARSLTDEVILISAGCDAVTGVADKVIHIAIPDGSYIDDAYATINAAFDSETPDMVFAQPTRRIKYYVGRLAAHAKTAAITDVIAFNDGLAKNLYFGGAACRKNKATGPVSIYTVGSGTFDPDATASGTDIVEEAAWVAPAVPVICTGTKELPVADVNLNAADVIVAAGRGFADEDLLQGARDLAAKVGGEVGCTRPLAEGDGAWFPREAYIGVTGVTATPKVFFGIGISGQMQHMVGINRSGTIIAINKDKNAPIFSQADYGIVGDLKTVLPALIEAL